MILRNTPMILRNTMKSVLIAVALINVPIASAATTVFQLSAESNGGFGNTGIFEPFMNLQTAFSFGPIDALGFTGPVAVDISATGTINLGGTLNLPTGPNGIPFDGFGVGQFSPLQESGVAPMGFEPNSGAIMGAFVPVDRIGPAFDVERGGAVFASDLFFVGSDFRFLAPSEGVLFLGINDPRASNNTGSFTVSIDALGRDEIDGGLTAVPLPAGILFLSTGLGLLGWGAYRSKNRSS